MDDEMIQAQRSRLQVYRRHLSHLLMQRESLGIFTPFHIINGILAAQEGINQCKAYLRSQGEVLEDLPDDDASAGLFVNRMASETAQIGRVCAPEVGCSTNINTGGGDLAFGNIDKRQTFINHIYESAPSLGAPSQVPEPAGDFIGRDREVGEISKRLSAASTGNPTVAIALLIGMGGIGKTELAHAIASKLRAHFPDAQLMIELRGASETPLTAEQALQRAIRAFNLQIQLPDDLEELKILYRSLLADKRVLILADDAKDRMQVRALTPPAGSALLITSRLRFTLPGMALFDIDTLPKAAAAKLLRTIYSKIGAYAPRLAQLCGYLPLALRVSASTLASLKAMRAEIDDYISRLEQERMQHLRDLDEPDDPHASVKASLALSYRMLGPDAQRTLSCLSIFPAPFDHSAAQAVAQVDTTQYDFGRDPICHLRRHSLLQQKAERLALHDLVRVFAQQSDKDAVAAAQQRYISHYAELAERVGQLLPQQRRVALELFRVDWTHFEIGWNWANEQPEARSLWRRYAVAVLPVFDRFCARTKRSQLLERAFERAAQTEDLALQARLLIGLGDTTVQMGTRDALDILKRAECYYQKARDIADAIDQAIADGGEALEGLDERVIACRAAIGLGMVSARRGERQLAIEHYLHGLALTRATHNDDDACLALSNLGNAMVEDGRVEEAIARYHMGLARAQQVEDQRIGVKLLRDLGAAYMVLATASDTCTPAEQCQQLWRRAGAYYEHSRALARALGDHEGKLTTAHFDTILRRLQEHPAVEIGAINAQADDHVGGDVCSAMQWADELEAIWRQRAEQAMALIAPACSYTTACA